MMGSTWIVLLAILVAVLIWWLFFWGRAWHKNIKKFTYFINNNDFDSALYHLQRAREIVRKYARNDPRSLIVDLEEAKYAVSTGDAGYAEKFIESVLYLCDKNNKIYDNIYARALLNLAEVSWQAGNTSKAEEFFNKTIKYRNEKFKNDKQAIAIALCRYSHFLAGQNRVDEAKTIIKRVEDLFQ